MKHKIFKIPALLAVVIGLLIACERSESGIDVNSSPGFEGGSGYGGSLARFTVAGDRLYTVDAASLKVFNITDRNNVYQESTKNVGFGVETIFPRGENLFLGTQFGMYIYDISDPANPQQKSYFEHIVSCDPVVADESYAYVTLNTANWWCGINNNQLQIVDISDLNNPFLKSSYDMTAPLGLAIHQDTLFVCDNGLKVFNVQDKMNIELLKHITDIQANDVIHYHGRLIVIGDDGFYQYKIEDGDIIQISSILIGN